MKRENRESTIERKIRYLKALNGSPQDMITQVLIDRSVDRAGFEPATSAFLSPNQGFCTSFAID
jgi:hypothetical protein